MNQALKNQHAVLNLSFSVCLKCPYLVSVQLQEAKAVFSSGKLAVTCSLTGIGGGGTQKNSTGGECD